ncbi:site-specific DNA-methyltransferase [Zhongshania sp.]|uniref:DNA-methyltransferase n=1 Tax=Zhongshania sp. TaxID=1971902 RepID=UPI00356A3E03
MSVEILNIDCMEYMASLPDKAFDLAIVDPPYGIGESGATNKSRGKLALAKDYKPFAGGDLCAPDSDYFDQLKRVSRNQIIWGANHFIDGIPFMCNSPCWVVWDKVNGGSDFADCELAWTSFKTAVRLFRFQWAGMLQGDMKNKEHRIHPTQKPVKLYQWLLANYAKEGDRILDTHLGSGSSAIAAHYGGFDFVGCELDEDYYKAACERFNNETAQEDMF